MQEKIRHLSDQVVRLRQELENGQSAYCEAQNNIAGLSERNSALESKIAVLKERMKDSEDKAARSQAELEKIHKLLKYSDEDMGENQSEEFPYTSRSVTFLSDVVLSL